jgi:hypothetical protein
MLNRLATFMDVNVPPSELDLRVKGPTTSIYFHQHAISSWFSGDYLNSITSPTHIADPSSGEQTVNDGQRAGMGSFHPTANGARLGFAAAVTDQM